MSRGTFDDLFGNAEISTDSTSSSGGSTPAVPGSGENNDIEVIGGFKLDKSFLNALYAGGKISAQQRESILQGADVSTLLLSQYDLFYLTVGRLGSRTAAASLKLIPLFLATAVYAVGDLVQYQPAGTSAPGLYQAVVAPPVGTLPTDNRYFQAIIAAPVSPLIDADIVCPAAAAVAAAGAGILGQGNNNGASLTPVTIPAGRRYRMWVSEIRGTNAGTPLPTDCHYRVELLNTEQINGDGSVTLTITPRWAQIATANNAAIAAITAGAFTARVKVELQ